MFKIFFIEDSNLTEDYKLIKEALDKGFELYGNNFDLDINTKQTCNDDVFEELVKFKSFQQMSPIKVVINRKEAKIIGLFLSYH